jgi:hypothetical protein
VLTFTGGGGGAAVAAGTAGAAAAVGTTAGRLGAIIGGRLGIVAELSGRAGRPPPLMNVFSVAISSSVRLASADPFPLIPARVQISTNFLLSIFSSLANA